MASYYFRDNEAQALLKPGELEEQLLSPADKAVVRAVDANRGHRITINGLMRKTGLSQMAVTLVTYRLVPLGLLADAGTPKNWQPPKRLSHQKGLPKPSRKEVLAEHRARERRGK